MSVKNRGASKYCDIYPYFFGGLTVLVWNRYVFPRSKMAVFQTYHKKHGIKIAVIWVEVLQLHKYTITVITWLCLNARMKITKALRKSIWMFTYFYASFFTNFRQLNTMMWLENTDSVTLEESKGFFQLQPPEEFCKKRCTKKFRKIHRKTYVPDLFFNKVAGLRHRCFLVNFGKFLRTSFLQNTSGRLLLPIIYYYYYYYYYYFLKHYLHKRKIEPKKTYNSTLLDIYRISVGEKLKKH